MKKRMIIMLLLCALVFGGVFGMKAFMNKMMVQFTENMPSARPTISAGPVLEMTWDNKLESIGSFVPVNGADVTAEVSGTVRAIHFESGGQATKGQLLVTLDSASERADLQRLKAQAELAELNRARREKLLNLEAISKSDYDAAISEAAAAQAAVQSQAARLAQKEIRAPFSGALGLRRVNVGQYVTPGMPIVSLQALDPIDLDFSLPEQSLAVAQRGLPVAVKVDSYGDTVFKGEVIAVEPRLQESTRAVGLRARLSNPEHKLRAGAFGRVTLQLPGARKILVIPRTAVNYSSYGTSVFLLQKLREKLPAMSVPGMAPMPETDTEVIQRFVKLGAAQGDFIEISEGLKLGDQVATAGLLKLRNGQPVVVDNSSPPMPELAPTLPPG